MSQSVTPADICDGSSAMLDFKVQPLGDAHQSNTLSTRRVMPQKWHLRSRSSVWRMIALPTRSATEASNAQMSCDSENEDAGARYCARLGVRSSFAKELLHESNTMLAQDEPEGSLLATRGDGYTLLAAGENMQRLRAVKSDQMALTSTEQVPSESNVATAAATGAAFSHNDIDLGDDLGCKRIFQVDALKCKDSPLVALRHEHSVTCIRWHLPSCTWEDGVCTTLGSDGYDRLTDATLNPMIEGEMLTVTERGAAYLLPMDHPKPQPKIVHAHDDKSELPFSSKRRPPSCCCYTHHPLQALFARGRCISLLDLRCKSTNSMFMFASPEEHIKWFCRVPVQGEASGRGSLIGAVSSNYVSVFDARMMIEPMLRWKAEPLPDGSHPMLAYPCVYKHPRYDRSAIVCACQNSNSLLSFPFDWHIGRSELSHSLLSTPALAQSSGDALRIKRIGRLKGLSLSDVDPSSGKAKLFACTAALDLNRASVAACDGSFDLDESAQSLPIGAVYAPPHEDDEDRRAGSCAHAPNIDEKHLPVEISINQTTQVVGGPMGHERVHATSQPDRSGAADREGDIKAQCDAMLEQNHKTWSAATISDVCNAVASSAEEMQLCYDHMLHRIDTSMQHALYQRCVSSEGLWRSNNQDANEEPSSTQNVASSESVVAKQAAWARNGAYVDERTASNSPGQAVFLSSAHTLGKGPIFGQDSALHRSVFSKWEELERRLHSSRTASPDGGETPQLASTGEGMEELRAHPTSDHCTQKRQRVHATPRNSNQQVAAKRATMMTKKKKKKKKKNEDGDKQT